MIDARFFITVFDGASEMEITPVSLFRCDMRSSESKRGNAPFSVARGNRGVGIDFFCPTCRRRHMFHFRLKALKRKGGHYIVCPSCQLDLGFIGGLKDVEEVVERHKREVEVLIKEMGFENFFKDPFVIYETINYIHDLAENKMLRCECHSRDIYAHLDYDKVVLSCRSCGNAYTVDAGNREDLRSLRQRAFLEIGSADSKLRKY